MRRKRSLTLRRSMFDERFGSGFILAIDWRGCRVEVDAFFLFYFDGGGFSGLAVVQ